MENEVRTVVARAQIVEMTWDFTRRQKAFGKSISFPLLCNKWSQIKWLKTTHTFIISVSVGQDSGHDLNVFLCSRSQKASFTVFRLHSQLKAWLGKNPFLSSFRLLAESIFLWLYNWREQLFADCWLDMASGPRGHLQSLEPQRLLYFFAMWASSYGCSLHQVHRESPKYLLQAQKITVLRE